MNYALAQKDYQTAVTVMVAMQSITTPERFKLEITAMKEKRDVEVLAFGVVTDTYKAAVEANREAITTAAKRSFVKSEKGSSGSGENKKQKLPEKKLGFGVEGIERLVQSSASSSSSSSSSGQNVEGSGQIALV